MKRVLFRVIVWILIIPTILLEPVAMTGAVLYVRYKYNIWIWRTALLAVFYAPMLYVYYAITLDQHKFNVKLKKLVGNTLYNELK